MKYPISLTLVAEAHKWWGSWFRDKTVPGLVSPSVMQHTCPKGSLDTRLFGAGTDTVVASAEQSFLQLEKDGSLNPGNWMALTPCYRDEIFDDTHLPVFLKLELMCLGKDGVYHTRSEAMHLAEKMSKFFRKTYGMPTHLVETEEGWDVMYDNLELGSFGVRRTLTGKSYIYGTGLAEPRASIALSRFEKGSGIL